MTESTDLSTEEQEALKKIADAKIKLDGQTLVWPGCPDWPSNFKTPGADLKQAHATSGSSASVTQGNSYTYKHGDSYTSTKGNSWSQSLGNSFSLTCGASESFKLSNDFSASLSGSESFSLGALNLSVAINGLTYKTGVALKTIDHTFGDLIKSSSANESKKVGGDYIIEAGKPQDPPGVIKKLMLGLQAKLATPAVTGPGKIELKAKDQFSIKSTDKDIEIATDGAATATDANINITSANNIQVSAAETLTLVCGQSTIILAKDKIEIISPQVVIGSGTEKQIASAQNDLDDAKKNESTAKDELTKMSRSLALSGAAVVGDIALRQTALQNKVTAAESNTKSKKATLDSLKQSLLTVDNQAKTAAWKVDTYKVTSDTSTTLENSSAKLTLSAASAKLENGAHSTTITSASNTSV